MPVFARGGAIVPLAPYADNVASLPNALTLKVFPHAIRRDVAVRRRRRGARLPARPVRVHARALHRAPAPRAGDRPARGSYPGQPATRDYTAVFVDVTRPHARDHRRAEGGLHVRRRGAAPCRSPCDMSRAPARASSSTTAARVADRPDPAVTFTLDAPDGLTAGQPGRVVATVTNHGPEAVHDVSVAIPAPAGWTVVRAPRRRRAARWPPATRSRRASPSRPPAPRPTPRMVATATYRNPDGSRSSLPASLTIKPRPVAVTFRVRVPAGMPPGDAVYLPGNIDQLGPWDPGKVAHDRQGRRHLGGRRSPSWTAPRSSTSTRAGPGRRSSGGVTSPASPTAASRSTAARTARCSSTTRRPPGTTRRAPTSTRPSATGATRWSRPRAPRTAARVPPPAPSR